MTRSYSNYHEYLHPDPEIFTEAYKSVPHNGSLKLIRVMGLTVKASALFFSKLKALARHLKC